MSTLIEELATARRSAHVSQAELAKKGALSRMTVQRTEAGTIDPRLSTLVTMARSLGMDLMLVPLALRPDLENFVRAGGKFLGQPVGVDAPPSIVDDLLAASKRNADKK
jgi:DNA-binding XRE family transcriptional regulator